MRWGEVERQSAEVLIDPGRLAGAGDGDHGQSQAPALREQPGQSLGLSVVPIPGTRKAGRIDENLGALTLDFTKAQLETLDAAADAVVGSRSADPNWVSEGRE